MSKNMELARIFAEIADVLDLTGANAFKVNANRKVARTLEEAGEDLAELARTDPARLRDIPGIGDSSAKKILEFVTTWRSGAPADSWPRAKASAHPVDRRRR